MILGGFREDYTRNRWKPSRIPGVALGRESLPAVAGRPGPVSRPGGTGCEILGRQTMPIHYAVLLGALQGLTEFVPVSSTAHLYLAQALLRIRNDEIALSFDVVLHLGTALALAAALWRDVLSMLMELPLWLAGRPARDPQARALLAPLIVGTVTGVLDGLFLLKRFEAARTLGLIGISMLVACAYFFFSERSAAGRAGAERPLTRLNLADGLLIGLAQAAAGLLAGFSRSGFTIATGLNRGLRREEAARFSFLLGLPLIAGAGGKALLDLRHEQGSAVGGPALVAGFLAAAIVGFVTVRLLLRFLKRHTLAPFAIYLGLLGIVLLGWSLARGLSLLGGH